MKVPLGEATAWAEPLAHAGANGLVIAQPLRGEVGATAAGTTAKGVVNGALYGPLTFALVLPVVRAVAQLQLPVALLACGGVHTVEQMHAALGAGAHAVQIDTAVWVEPGLPKWLSTAWQEQMAHDALD